jgi:hypothetical protein
VRAGTAPSFAPQLAWRNPIFAENANKAGAMGFALLRASDYARMLALSIGVRS